MKELWKQVIKIQVASQLYSYEIKGEDGGGCERNTYHISADKSEHRGPQWSRTVEDIYSGDKSDPTEVDNVPRDSNQLLQVPVDATVSK